MKLKCTFHSIRSLSENVTLWFYLYNILKKAKYIETIKRSVIFWGIEKKKEEFLSGAQCVLKTVKLSLCDNVINSRFMTLYICQKP